MIINSSFSVTPSPQNAWNHILFFGHLKFETFLGERTPGPRKLACPFGRILDLTLIYVACYALLDACENFC